MTPERFQQIDKLVAAALQLDAAERKAFLARACAGDAALRREVESLLAAEAQASGFLDTPAPVKFAELLAEKQGAKNATGEPMILNGRYQVGDLDKDKLGEGGFGVVYLARDLRLQPRRVVVKVLHPDIRRSGSLKTRFFREMDALARFEMPHIVAILDKGETPDGHSFFVMEYVEGSELRRAMRTGRMEFARVARLMRQIAQAVSYAHDRLVFHRDLKPENIMLRLAAGDESAVLLDFSIATVKEWQPPTRGAKTAIIGTPACMAPEQIEGEPSAASDIWALPRHRLRDVDRAATVSGSTRQTDKRAAAHRALQNAASRRAVVADRALPQSARSRADRAPARARVRSASSPRRGARFRRRVGGSVGRCRANCQFACDC
jgi:serine/threonine-protein kinase